MTHGFSPKLISIWRRLVLLRWRKSYCCTHRRKNFCVLSSLVTGPKTWQSKVRDWAKIDRLHLTRRSYFTICYRRIADVDCIIDPATWIVGMFIFAASWAVLIWACSHITRWNWSYKALDFIVLRITYELISSIDIGECSIVLLQSRCFKLRSYRAFLRCRGNFHHICGHLRTPSITFMPRSATRHCDLRLFTRVSSALFTRKAAFTQRFPGREGGSQLIIVSSWEPEGHVLARRRKHHILGIKLNTAHGYGMLCFQYCEFVSGVGVPSVHTSVAGTWENKLRVGAEWRFQGDTTGVGITCNQR